MQACEVCGWDTRSGARVCSACRLERGEGEVETTAADTDPNGSSLLHDLLAASHERAGGGTTTAVRRVHGGDDTDRGTTADEPHVNGSATPTTVGMAPGGDDMPAEAAIDGAEDDAAEAAGASTGDDADATRATAPDTAAASEEPATAPLPEAAPPAAAGTTDERSGADEAPRTRTDRLRAAFQRAGAWTGVAQLALLVLGMLCVFQIVVLVVVYQFLSQSGTGAVSGADALAANAKVTGTMFPALAVIALAVAVFAGARSSDDSGRGGVHRRVAGLPPTLWAIVATATAVLTMGLLDAASTLAQARDVALRAIVVCAVLGLAAFLAPRGFAAPELADDGPQQPARAPDADARAPEAPRQRSQAPQEPGPERSAPADGGS